MEFATEMLIKEMDALTKMPGLVNSWGYPIKIRMDMVTTGIRTPVGIKVSGGDLNKIGEIAVQVEQAVKTASIDMTGSNLINISASSRRNAAPNKRYLTA